MIPLVNAICFVAWPLKQLIGFLCCPSVNLKDFDMMPFKLMFCVDFFFNSKSAFFLPVSFTKLQADAKLVFFCLSSLLSGAD